MALFHCSLCSHASFNVSYHVPSPPVAPPSKSQQTLLEIPFEPKIEELKKLCVKIHTAPDYPAYQMPDAFNTWFSECFSFPVILAYLGNGVGVHKQDAIAKNWISNLSAKLPAQSLSSVTFSDGLPLLIVSEASIVPLHDRLNGEQAVLEKFRPNIVVSDPALEAWEEDYWAELVIPRLGARIIMTANCARCMSINVDLEKGRFGEGESGKLLKKMMRDRRVDSGKKWEPIFGRYGFPVSGGIVKVGDEIEVSMRNQERTVWSKLHPTLPKSFMISSFGRRHCSKVD